MTETRMVYRCGSHARGHDPHFMAVLRRLRPGERERAVAICDVRLIDIVTVEIDVERKDGIETLVMRNHDAVRLAVLWSGARGAILDESALLVAIDVGGSGRPWFSVTDKELDQCRSPKGQAW